MSDAKQEWFLSERARSMAMIHLTRRDDLSVANAPKGVGLEFLVAIAKAEDRPALRQFGVFLRGTRSAATLAALEKTLRLTMQSFARIGDFPYPAVLFHFTMEDDEGYFAWVAEPVVEAGAPRLLMHESAQVQKLDRAALDLIVAKSDAWYDAFFARIVAKAS